MPQSCVRVMLVRRESSLACRCLPGCQRSRMRLSDSPCATRVMDEIMDGTGFLDPEISVEWRSSGVTIFPSTIKAGFIFGGHRGKGVVLARDAETGALVRAGVPDLDWWQFWAPDRRTIGRPGADRHESAWFGEPASERVDDRRRCVRGRRSGWARPGSVDRYPTAGRDLELFSHFAVCLPA